MVGPDSDDSYEDSFSKKKGRGGGGGGGRKGGGRGSRGVCLKTHSCLGIVFLAAGLSPRQL